ncbi:tRNA (adenosine(37)-N6)-dimethylallyltransferase MiaA [Porphyromonas loveana]|uniref:tRNA dimethylallyltransferase n=1 Tax=Porphyromonas loveana TaxID=1884669 RepID=A0A2U1FAW2_9PORP|nr:tRNA (adenosine(37)-N6)-dimethylallyltransferase MiaA [Porphyromonas loveana]PVZ09322.1 tRNA dimethylallyltransferase [Porphyromonas loveana]
MITILGPTACGKTRLAVSLALRLGTEIISADSRQIYCGMDIGTGKDLADYQVGGITIPYHLIDIRPAGDKYNLFAYQHDFHRAYEDITRRGMEPVLCGGTGMYIEAVLKGYHLPDVPPNPSLRASQQGKTLAELTTILAGYGPLHNKTDVDSAQRAIRAIEIADFISRQPAEQTEFAPIDSLIIGLDLDRDTRRRRITDRLHARLQEGMLDEVRGLLDSGIPAEDLIYYGLEYKYVTLYITRQTDYQTMFTRLETAIHQFAKRQMTWFRGMERRGFRIHWINALLPVEEQCETALSLYADYGGGHQ